MTERQVTYRTKDGAKFASKEEAERHEKLIETKEAYEKARRDYATALFETQKTADGLPFELGAFNKYYYVSNVYWDWPGLQTVNFYYWSLDMDERDQAIIRHRENGVATAYRINELYAYKRNAEIALVKAREKRLKQLVEDLEERKEALGLQNREEEHADT